MKLNKDYGLPNMLETQIEELLEEMDGMDLRDFDEAKDYDDLQVMLKDLNTFVSKTIQVIQSAQKQGVEFPILMMALGMKEEEMQ